MFKNIKRYLRFFKLSIYALLNKETRNSSTVYSKKKMALALTESFSIPSLGNYVLQGISFIKGYLFITCYDNLKENSSKVMIFQNDTLVHETFLNTQSHVGGICYDSINNLIWITDSHGTVSSYNYEDILFLDNAKPVYAKIKVINNAQNIYGNNATAFITYYNKRIYVGNYNQKKYSKIISYEVLKGGELALESYKEIKGLDFIQGLAFTNYEDKTYLLVSSSFILKKSLIRIYLFDDSLSNLDEEKVLSSYKLNPFLEQITIDNKGNLIVAFESNAKKFKKYRIKNHDVEIYDLRFLQGN